MEMKGKQIVQQSKKIPKFILIGYLICIIVVICAAYFASEKMENGLPDAIDFTTNMAIGMEEGKYAYLDVQGITDEVAIYGNTDDESDSANDRYCIAYNNGYWYVVDLDFATIDKLQEIKNYTYTTDEEAKVPEPVRIYGMTEKVSDELKQMLVDYYNTGLTDDSKISINDFERYFGSALLNVRKSPVDTSIEDTVMILGVIGLIILGIYNIVFVILNSRVKKYIRKNGYKDELINELDDYVEEKYYKDKIIITKNFFVDIKSPGFTMFKFSDVKWVHIHNVKYYGVLTVSSSIIVHLNDGKTNINCVRINGKVSDEFLSVFNKICDKVPENCIKGYTPENIKEFKEYKKEIEK